MNFSQESRAKQLSELARVTAICLDAITGLHRNQRRRDHEAAQAHADELPLQNIAQWAGLVRTDDVTRCLPQYPPGPPPNGSRLRRKLTLRNTGFTRLEHRRLDRMLVRIQSDIRDILIHDRLLRMRL